MISGPTRQPFTQETLAPLADRYGERWRIWPSAQGLYACATLRRGLAWVRTQGVTRSGPVARTSGRS